MDPAPAPAHFKHCIHLSFTDASNVVEDRVNQVCQSTIHSTSLMEKKQFGSAENVLIKG
jgi:hypothetical protein